MNGPIFALNALNFCLADVRDGLGPFLGVFLQSRNWSPSEIGVVMTIGGLAGVAATTPAGAWIDRTTAKRAAILIAAAIIVAACLVTVVVPSFAMVTVAQSINGLAAAVVPAAIAGLTFGLIRPAGLAHQLGRNEAFNHAGNVAAAVLAGLFGYLFGIAAVFVVMAGMAAASAIAVSWIDPHAIDHRAARGEATDGTQGASGFHVLMTSRPLIVLGVTLLLLHLGNAAMLPLLGQALVARGAGDASAFTGATVVVAQFTMVPIALLAGRLAELRGYWLVFLLALIALPVRGSIAALVDGPLGLIPVQMLDGVGAGLLGVAVPGLVARMLDGTGHVNVGLGAVMTLQGVGAALSPAVGGWAAERLGYSAAFAVLGAIAAVALLLWLAARPVTATVCAALPDLAAPQPAE